MRLLDPESTIRPLGGEEALKCLICKQGETLPGTATVTLERESLPLVTKGIPAPVCAVGGEEYVGPCRP